SQSEQLFLVHHPLEGRHNRPKSGGYLGAGIEDGFANVVVVRANGLAVVEQHGLTVEANEVRTASLGVEAMTGGAAELLKELLPDGGEGSLRCAAGEPALILGRLHHYDFTDHSRMQGAAVLGAEQVIAASLSGTEPGGDVAVRQDVLLDAERGDVKAVDDVLGDHGQAHVAPDGYMELVDLPRTLRMLELPHPLLADDEDLHGIRRRPHLDQVDDSAPDEHQQESSEGQHAPGALQRVRALDLRGHRITRAAIAEGEDEDQKENHHREEAGDGNQENIDCVHLTGEAGGATGPKRKILPHTLGASSPDGSGARSRRPGLHLEQQQ